MALDATARESNLRDSIKKYLVDNLYTVEGIPVLFDPNVNTPNLLGRTTDRWFVGELGSMERGDMSEAIYRLTCCTREDNEGFKLAQLVDKAMSYLSDGSGDGTRRIDYYQSSAIQAWTKIGGIVVHSIEELGESFGPDKTRYKVLIIRLRFASKI